MLPMSGGPRELTDDELRDLRMYEDAISRVEEAEYRTKGQMFRAIRDRRLYRHEGTFEDYCRARWGYRRQTVNGYVRAVEVAEDLEACGVRGPATRKQALALWRLGSGQRLAVAGRVDDEGGWRRVSARRVGAIAEEVAPVARAARVPERRSLVVVRSSRGVGPVTVGQSGLLRDLEETTVS